MKPFYCVIQFMTNHKRSIIICKLATPINRHCHWYGCSTAVSIAKFKRCCKTKDRYVFYLSTRLFSNKKKLTAAVYVACLDFIKSSKFHVHKRPKRFMWTKGFHFFTGSEQTVLLLICDYFDKSTRKRDLLTGIVSWINVFHPHTYLIIVQFRFSIYTSAGVFPLFMRTRTF